MGRMAPTANGYDFFECSSTLQKAIRRNEVELAGFFALELFHSGYWKYVWKRLLTISAEDCYGVITHEIEALYKGFLLVNEGKGKKEKGRIFISKAVILLCKSTKSRDADHLQNLIYDKRTGLNDITIKDFIDQVPDSKIQALMDEIIKDPKLVPDYAFDVHTMKGKRKGKTKEDFFRDEQEALSPKQISIWDIDNLL